MSYLYSIFIVVPSGSDPSSAFEQRIVHTVSRQRLEPPRGRRVRKPAARLRRSALRAAPRGLGARCQRKLTGRRSLRRTQVPGA